MEQGVPSLSKAVGGGIATNKKNDRRENKTEKLCSDEDNVTLEISNDRRASYHHIMQDEGVGNPRQRNR